MSPDDAKATIPLPASPPSAERATVPLPGSDASTVPPDTPATIGRFVVRGWLGAGAFGDVYRAFDPHLDREVAVKVAKAGSLNTPERLARFLREAKAAANLRHPHIVPLYETGTDGDRRFIVSAFIDGRTLEAVVLENPGSHAGGGQGPTPLPLHTVADIGRKLADALAYAHSQGVVHRDVKPANVLLDAAGDPHLLDFGLAAREEEGAERLTQDGQGMGTPAYMAPEQADGKGEAASDQYSLGCTLYELATGRTPFAGGPVQQMFLHQSQPVPSPRSLRPNVPKDLDTLILKCLEKEPARRYATCADLSDDLRRFVSGEPVTARRAGPVERLTRWAKRNKKVAGMGLLVLLTMTLGAGFSFGFGLYANDQAGIARGEKKKAEDKTAEANKERLDAINARNDLAKANDDLGTANETMERSLVKAILGPILARSNYGPNRPALASDDFDPMSEQERAAIWELVSHRQGRIGGMVLAEATSTHLSARQLHHRAAYLTHAVVGLDSRRQRVADALFADKLRDDWASAELKREVALAAVDAERFDASDAIAARLMAEVRNPASDSDQKPLTRAVLAVAARLPADQAEEACRAAANGVLSTMNDVGYDWVQDILIGWLTVVAERLPADTAREVYGKAADSVLAALGREFHLREVNGLAVLVERLPGVKATEVSGKAADILLSQLERSKDDFHRRSLARTLAAFAKWLPVERREDVCRQVANLLLSDLRKNTLSLTSEYRPAVPIGRLPTDKAADLLLAALQTATSAAEREQLAEGIAAAAERLPADKREGVCRKAADLLLEVLVKTPAEHERDSLTIGLAAVAEWLPADKAVEMLVAALGKAKFSGELWALARGLEAVAGRLPADKAAEACGQMVEVLSAALRKQQNFNSRHTLAEGLVAVARWLPASQAEEVYLRAANVLHMEIQRTKTTGLDSQRLVEGLLASAERIPAEKAAEWLLAALRGSKYSAERQELSHGLAAVAGRLPADKGEEVCRKAADMLTAALTKARHWSEIEGLADGLGAVAGRLPADKGEEVCRKAVDLLLDALGMLEDSEQRKGLSKGLGGLAAGLSGRDLARHKHATNIAALAGSVTLHPDILPKPRPLPPHQLVELLKHPFCVKEARRAVLDALEFTYDRKFGDLWEFVAFAEKEHPELDLLTPPKRPEKVTPAKADGKPK